MPSGELHSFDVPLKAWTGAPGRSLIQGLSHEPVTGQWYVTQADVVAGQVEEDVAFRRHSKDLAYLDMAVSKSGGHGSTTGVQWTEKGIRCWLGHNVLGPGYFLFGSSNRFTKVPGIPNGDIAVDAQHDLLCVRVKNRYRIYVLSSVAAGDPVLLCDDTITDWYKRFQGHRVTRLADGRVCLLVHRDVATKQASRVRWFVVSSGELVRAGELDTTGMGDEAEGVTEFDGALWVTKRVGDTGPGRVVRATKLAGLTPAPASVKPLRIGGELYDPLDSVSVYWVNQAREAGTFSRHVYYVQKWLNRAVPSSSPLVEDGHWGPKTQAAYDTYRRTVLKLAAADATGEVGFTSLSRLNDSARASIAVREGK